MAEYLDPLLVTFGGDPQPISGTFTSTPLQLANSTTTRVTATTSNTILLASNSARQMATICNYSDSNLFVKLGVSASILSFTVRIPRNSYYEFPLPIYTGEVDGFWETAIGAATLTEFY